jgi:hypothetical protein
MEGRIIPLLVESFYSVRLVKQIIAEKSGILVDSQRLLYCNKQLEDYNTFASYKIQNESTLLFILRLRGD